MSKDRWYGRKANLEFKAERYPAGFKLEFFQNIVTVNSNGGFYDFDKYKLMPYLIKLLFRNELRHIKHFLESLGHVDTLAPTLKRAYDQIVQRYIESWHKPQTAPFRLEDLHGTTCDHSYNNQDRDKKTIFCGQVKYFRRRDGSLARGIVYHNINNMWWVILSENEFTNVADFHLFDPTEEDYRIRRLPCI